MTFEDLIDRPIAFNRAYVFLGVGITGALMLSQAVYWSKRAKADGRWFYKTRDEWEEETGLTRTEQETARRKLCEIGVMEEIKKGVPRKIHFRVNIEKLRLAMVSASRQESCQLDGGKPADCMAGNLPTNTETTAETTHKSSSAQQAEQIPYDMIFESFEKNLPMLPKPKLRTDKRKGMIRRSWKLDKRFQSIEWWDKYFAHVSKSNFLTGRSGAWKNCGFEWLVHPDHLSNVIDGKYDNA